MLTPTELALLDAWKRHPSRRDLRLNIYAEHGLSETRATQIVNALIGRPEAWEWDPILMGRLNRLRQGRP